MDPAFPFFVALVLAAVYVLALAAVYVLALAVVYVLVVQPAPFASCAYCRELIYFGRQHRCPDEITCSADGPPDDNDDPSGMRILADKPPSSKLSAACALLQAVPDAVAGVATEAVVLLGMPVATAIGGAQTFFGRLLGELPNRAVLCDLLKVLQTHSSYTSALCVIWNCV
jgi:hypothetical protein